MLSKLANVPTIPYESMEFWNATAIEATTIIALVVGAGVIVGIIVACVHTDADALAISVYSLIIGAVVWLFLVLIPYLFIDSSYMSERKAENLTELEYENVRMQSHYEFTATKDGKYITGQLVDAPSEYEYYVIEISSAKVE